MTPKTRPIFSLPVLLAGACLLVLPGAALAKTPWLGVAFSPGGSTMVTRVLPTSPAAKAGFKRGDVISTVNGQSVSSSRDVITKTAAAGVGATVPYQVIRAGSSVTLRVRIGANPGFKKLYRLFMLNTRAPDFSVPIVCGGSGSTRLSALRGKVVLLYFWATWCESCKKSMPKLKKLQANFGNKGLRILTLGRDKSRSLLESTSKRLGLPFKVGHHPGNRVGLLYKSSSVPTLLLVDKKGVIRDALVGSTYNYARLESSVKRLLRMN